MISLRFLKYSSQVFPSISTGVTGNEWISTGVTRTQQLFTLFVTESKILSRIEKTDHSKFITLGSLYCQTARYSLHFTIWYIPISNIFFCCHKNLYYLNIITFFVINNYIVFLKWYELNIRLQLIFCYITEYINDFLFHIRKL